MFVGCLFTFQSIFLPACFGTCFQNLRPVVVACNAVLQVPEEIQMVQFAASGNLFFLTKTSKVYLGDANSASLTVIKEKVAQHSLIRLDRFERPWLIRVSDKPTGSEQEFLDSDTQLSNSDPNSPVCPYSIFEVVGDELYRPVDIGTSYTVQASLWFPVGNAVDLEVIVSRPTANNHFTADDMNITILTDRVIEGGVVKVTKTIIMQNGFSRVPNESLLPLARESPVTTVTIHPSATQPSCTDISQRVFFTKAACPAGLSIRLIPQSPCAAPYPTTVNVPAEYLGQCDLKYPA